MVLIEKGLFKENIAVFVDKIESVAKDKFCLQIKPYWAINNEQTLFSNNFCKSLWKKMLDIYKYLNTPDQADIDPELRHLFKTQFDD